MSMRIARGVLLLGIAVCVALHAQTITFFAVSPATVNFAGVSVGASASQNATLTTLTNFTLNAPITLQLQVTSDNPAFTVSPASFQVLVNGQALSTNVAIAFRPTVTGPATARITFTATENIFGAPPIVVQTTTISVTGTGTVTPNITSLNPSTAVAGGPGLPMTVNGTNLAVFGTPGVVFGTVLWNGQSLPVTSGSATQLTVMVPANLIAVPGTATVTVSSGGQQSNPVTFTITPRPTIMSLIPPSAVAGGPSFTLTVNGANFASGAVVQWNGQNLPTTFVTATQLTATVAATLIASVRTASIMAISNGVPTNSVSFAILGPTITSLNPPSAVAGGPSFTLTVNGANFATGAVVQWNGQNLPTTFVTATQLTATVAATLIATAGTASVTAISNGVPTNSVSFTILGPAITSLNPPSAVAGGPTFTLTVNGANFASGAVVQWNGQNLPTTFVTATQLTTTVAATLIATAGTASVTVVSGGLTSNAVSFVVGSVLLTTSASSLAFGNVITNDSASQTLTISSAPATAALASVTVQLTTDNTAFTVSPASFQLTLTANGTSSNVQVTFTPRSAGALSGRLTLTASTAQMTLQTTAVSLTGVGALVTASPGTLNFGDVPVNSSATLATTLTAPVQSAAESLPLRVTSDNPAFVPSLATPSLLTGPNGGTVALRVAFSPKTAGAINGNVAVTILNLANTTLQALLIPVTGSGADVQLNPTSVDFGNQDVGTTSAAKNLILSNQTGAPISGAASVDNAAFKVAPAQFTVNPGATQSLAVTFQPSAQGAIKGTISVLIQRGNQPQTFTVAVTGTGQITLFTVSPSSLDFGTIAVQASSAPQNLTVSNPSAAGLTVSVTASNAAFRLTPGSFTVPARGSTTVVVVFTPPSVAGFTGNAVFTATVAGSTSTVTVALTGVGGAATLSFSVADGQNSRPLSTGQTIDFGSIDVGSQSALHLTISNAGQVPANVQTISSTGAGYSATNVPALPVTLVPGGSARFDVVFAPAALGSLSGQLVVNGQQFPLTGTGTAPSAPGVTVMGAPATATSSQNSNVTVRLSAPYPLGISGQLSIRFTPDVVNNCPNPPILFEDGNSAVAFSIPQGQTQAVFQFSGRTAQQVAVQFGSVAGSIALMTSLATGTTDITPDPAPSSATVIARAAPDIIDVQIANKTVSGFDVVIVGDALSREVTQANFRLVPAAGANLQTTQLSVPVTTAFNQWWGMAQSCTTFGSAFKLTQSFSLQGSNTAIGQVGVTLVNSAGNSKETTVTF